jgi:type I restriction enzyme R subunit
MPEDEGRASMGSVLVAAGWTIQNRAGANIDAVCGVAIRQFAMGHCFDEDDYLFVADRWSAGGVQAKADGTTLLGVEIQTQEFSEGNSIFATGRTGAVGGST